MTHPPRHCLPSKQTRCSLIPTSTRHLAAVKLLVHSANTISTNRLYNQHLVAFVDFHEHLMHVPMRIPALQVPVNSNIQAHTLTMDRITIADGYSCTITLLPHRKSATAVLAMLKQLDIHHCPVTALLNYLRLRGEAPGVIFIDKAGKLVTLDEFAQHLKLCLQDRVPSHIYYKAFAKISRNTQHALYHRA